MSSCSTIQSNRFRRDRRRYARQNENIPPKYPKDNDALNLSEKFNAHHARARAHRMKDPDKQPSHFHRVQQPRSVADNFLFTNNKQEQRRVDRSKSDCRSKIPIRIRTKPTSIVDDRQRYSTPSSRFYPNPPTQMPLFNPFQTHAKHFQCL